MTGFFHFYSHLENCLILCGFPASISEVFFWIFSNKRFSHWLSGCLQFVHIFRRIFKKGHNTPFIHLIKFSAIAAAMMPPSLVKCPMVVRSMLSSDYQSESPSNQNRIPRCALCAGRFSSTLPLRQVQPLFNVQLYHITKWLKNKPFPSPQQILMCPQSYHSREEVGLKSSFDSL